MRLIFILISVVIILLLGAYFTGISPSNLPGLKRFYPVVLEWAGIEPAENMEKQILQEAKSYFSFLSSPNDLPQAVIQRYFENIRKGDAEALSALSKLEVPEHQGDLAIQATQHLKHYGGLVPWGKDPLQGGFHPL